MGIPGLTTFIEDRSDLLMDDLKLHNTRVVIDGNSLACHIYQQCYSNSCFGGDYDRYGRKITVFFETLLKCKITPYVVFDGGYESRKMKTIMSRLKDRIRAAEKVSSAKNGSTIFPLFTQEALKEIGFKKDVKMVQCDFESDIDIGNIARRLKCPVLSSDSDFYIVDGLYIPLTKLNMTLRNSLDPKTKKSYNYLQCKIYNVDKFICSNQLDRNTLPLLAVLLGNDYVKKGIKPERITSVLEWLKNETRESAIRKVLGRCRKENRKKILETINNAIKGCNSSDSIYLEYLGISPPAIKSQGESLDINILGHIEEPLESENYQGKEMGSDDDQEIIFHDDNEDHNFPSIFKENFRKCLYPPFFMNLFFRHTYYCSIAQVEDVSADNAYVVSFDIIAAMFKILTGLCKGLSCVGRVGKLLGKIDVPAYNGLVPTLEEIENMDCTNKQKVFFRILKLDSSFEQYLDLFPDSWHIYIMAMKYAIDKSKLSLPLMYALILSKMILSCIDYKTWFIRSVETFQKKFAAKLSIPIGTRHATSSAQNVSDCLNKISTIDSIHCMNSLLQYFKKNCKVASSRKAFNRKLVHSISEFQNILWHLKCLNKLLQGPFHDFNVSDCLNCTFVYNFTADLAKQEDIKNYLNGLLCKAPSVLTTVHAAVSAIDKKKSKPPPKKQKKKKVRNDQYKKCSNSVSMSFRGT